MFQIKICGITNLADARHAVEAGADAVGLNFYSRTPRYVTPATAREIRQAMPKDVLCVGVFVNATAAEVATIADAVGLDALQFHGDESPHALAEYRKTAGRVATLPLIRAFRCRDNGYPRIAAYIDDCRGLGVNLTSALIDAYVEGKYGGGGESIDWTEFRESRPLFGKLPLILAGGLTPDNVAAAIAAARPDTVDVASGVEAAPGHKDHDAMRRFVENARRAWEKMNG